MKTDTEREAALLKCFRALADHEANAILTAAAILAAHRLQRIRHKRPGAAIEALRLVVDSAKGGL